MVDPSKTCLFIPPEILQTRNGQPHFKMILFERIGSKLGSVIRGDFKAVENLPDEIIPIVGCTPQLRPIIDGWLARKRKFVYWDRGYARRVFAASLPRGTNGGYYRYHINGYQLRKIRTDLPADRWNSLKIDVRPWQKNGKHIVIAAPTMTYSRFHALDRWIEKTMDFLSLHTGRQFVIRCKEQGVPGRAQTRDLLADLEGAHCVVSHGSIAAVEAVIYGCPVFVDPSSAAALVGRTDLSKIEHPVYPDRQAWLNSLAYSQFNETELVDGTLWRLLT